MTSPHDSSYLWDRSGPADSDIAKLESLLSSLRHAGTPPALPVRRSVFRRVWPLSLAAAMLLVATAAWLFSHRAPSTLSGWLVTGESGPHVISSAGASASISTGAGASLNLARGSCRLWVGAETELSLLSAPPEAIAGTFTRGTLFADVTSDVSLRFAFPRGEIVIAPNTSANIRLPDPVGPPESSGSIELKRGMVQLTLKGRLVRVLPGRAIDLRLDGVSTPRPDSPALGPAIRQLDNLLDRDPASPDLTAALADVMHATGPTSCDAAWNLVWRLPPPARDRLLEDMRRDLDLAALPPGAGDLNPEAMDALWRAIVSH